MIEAKLFDYDLTRKFLIKTGEKWIKKYIKKYREMRKKHPDMSFNIDIEEISEVWMNYNLRKNLVTFYDERIKSASGERATIEPDFEQGFCDQADEDMYLKNAGLILEDLLDNNFYLKQWFVNEAFKTLKHFIHNNNFY